MLLTTLVGDSVLSIDRGGQGCATEARTMEGFVEESVGQEPRQRDDTQHAWSGGGPHEMLAKDGGDVGGCLNDQLEGQSVHINDAAPPENEELITWKDTQERR